VSPSTSARETVLVTGASSGIGYELCDLLGADGFNLVLVARDRARLEETAEKLRGRWGISVRSFAKDLSSPESAGEVVRELEREGIPVDILVNNAGFGRHGFFTDLPPGDQLGMIHLNILTLTHLTHLLLPGMLAKGNGKILNVASTAGFLPGPLMAVYYATKAYVVSFSVALAHELKGQGVSVTALCPGPTATRFQERARMGNIRFLTDHFRMNARRVAREGLEGMRRGKTLVIPGTVNKILVLAARFLPRNFIAQAVKDIQKRS
jgi:short-subunit dehydrogenase